MLRCTCCRYDLAGLVKDAAPVVCPECGRETAHMNGQPVLDCGAWQVLGRAKWFALFGPSAVVLLGVVVLGAVDFGSHPPFESRGEVVKAIACAGMVSLAASLAWSLTTNRNAQFPEAEWYWGMMARWFLSVLMAVAIFGVAIIGLLVVYAWDGLP